MILWWINCCWWWGWICSKLKIKWRTNSSYYDCYWKAGYKAGEQVAIALDVAASELINESGKYVLHSENRELTSAELVAYYADLCSKYPIVSIEDGLSEDDWDGWKILTDTLGSKVQLVGDDLFVTNASILAEGIKKGIANSILIKPNQIGSVSETINYQTCSKEIITTVWCLIDQVNQKMHLLLILLLH